MDKDEREARIRHLADKTGLSYLCVAELLNQGWAYTEEHDNPERTWSKVPNIRKKAQR